ncbi:MAG: hypothetical protein PVJ57_17750 [Phycisphaerae bacterium]
MKVFKDNENREWQLAVNVNAMKRVRGLLDVNLLDFLDNRIVERFYGDPVLLCDVIYAICKPQADAAGVSDEDFGRAMAGDAIDAATKALLKELVNFCPSPRDRANLNRVLDVTQTVMDRARDVIETKLAEIDVDQIVEQVQTSLNAGSGSVPASLASIPDR